MELLPAECTVVSSGDTAIARKRIREALRKFPLLPAELA